MTLRELLDYIEFDAELDENNEIRLIDKQNVYLGDIGECRYEPKQDSVADIIDRCEIYWLDYVIRPLIEDIGCSDDLEDDWSELYKVAFKHYGSNEVDKNTILGYLIMPDSIELDKELQVN